VALNGGVDLQHAAEPPRRDSLGLAFELHGLDGLGLHGVTHQAVGRFAEQDLGESWPGRAAHVLDLSTEVSDGCCDRARIAS
jgi:hypothetical protein